MHYVITGSAGHISKPLALTLLEAGHQVTVIGRTEASLQSLAAAGASIAIGSVEDVAFLTSTFTGADAIYAMIPPNYNPQNWQQYIAGIGENYAKAVEAAGVTHVVLLSSIGAHMPTGCGPVSGLYYAEQHLNSLANVHVIDLRPAYFYYNHLSSIPMVKGMGIIGSNYGPNIKLAMAATNDIAKAAAEELLALSFTGKSIRYIVSDEKTTAEIASILGTAINNPALPWVEFTNEQLLGGLLQAGLSEEMAKNYVEMGEAINTGQMAEDFEKYRSATTFSPTKFEQFAIEFANVYNQ